MMRRRMMMQGNGSAPPGIRFVSALIGDGKAYIDTGYYCDFEHRYVMGIADVSKMQSNVSFFGTSKQTTQILSSNFGMSGGIAAYHNGSNYRYSKAAWNLKKIELSKESFFVDGEKVSDIPNVENVQFEETLLVFVGRTQEIESQKARFGMSKFEVWNGKGQQILDMRPAVDNENVPGLYDMVSGKMFYNAAADGQFTWEE